MRGAAEFCKYWLIRDGNGKLVTSPSTSPENLFISDGSKYAVSIASTMDMSIINNLFTNVAAASAFYQIDENRR